MVKRFVSFLFFLMILGLFGLLIVPNFIDWNQHKDKIISVIAGHSDADIKIEGEVYFKVLPQPQIVLGAVSINQGVISAEKLAARVKLAPLLEGDIEFDSLNLVKPVFNLIVDKTGQKNWEQVKLLGSTKLSKVGQSSSVRLNNVTVEEARFVYHNQQNGTQSQVNNINLDISANTLYGPYSIMGTANYAGEEFVVDIKSKEYKGKAPVSFKAEFKPVDNTDVPSVKLSGVLDTKPFGIQGQLTLQEGRLDYLLSDKNLENISFLKETSSASALVDISAKKVVLSDLSLKVGKEAGANGKGELVFFADKPPKLILELDGNNLTLTNRSLERYIQPPSAFTGDIKFKGRNTVIAGENISFLNTRVVFEDNEWDIKSSAAYLRGKSKIDFSGSIKPSINAADYKTKISTEDFKALAENLPIGKTGLLHAVAKSKSAQNMQFDGHISISPQKVSLYNMKASLGDIGALEGVVNIDRTLSTLNANARVTSQKLNLTNTDKELVKSLINGEIDFEVTANKVTTTDSSKLEDVRFKGVTKAGKLKIEMLSASMDKNQLALTGKIDSIYPISNVDLVYNLSKGNARNVAKLFGVEDPPVLFSTVSKGIEGYVKGSSDKYAFELKSQSSENQLEVKGTKTGQIYDADIEILAKDTHKVLREMSLPIDSVANYEGRLQFSGKLKGTAAGYSIENIDAKIGKHKISGSMQKLDSKHTASIELSEIDIDKTLSENLKVEDNFILTLSGKSSWGGQAQATLTSNSIEGKITGVDLNHLATKMGLDQNLEFWQGDIDFKLNPSGSEGLRGDAKITSSLMRIKNFNYTSLGTMLNNLDYTPDNLRDMVRTELASGDIEFKDVEIDLDVKGDGVLRIKPGAELQHSAGTLTIREANGNVQNKTYHIEVGLAVKQPKPIPTFEIRKSSTVKGYNFDVHELEKFVARNNPPPVQVQTIIEAVPAASEALPPVTEPALSEPENPVDSIIDELEEDEMMEEQVAQ